MLKDHNGRDNRLDVLKHSIEKRHTEVEMNDFKTSVWKVCEWLLKVKLKFSIILLKCMI